MNRFVWAVVLFTFAFSGCLYAESNSHSVCCGSSCYKTHFVQNRAEHLTGLSGPRTLARDEAMLFAYETPGRNAMWMKGMQFPLDMLWLDQNKKIVSVKRNLAPCIGLQCQTYRSLESAMYVLEVNAGVSLKDSLEVGQLCQWDDDADIYRAPSL